MLRNYSVLCLLLFFAVTLDAQNFTGNWNVVSIESNGNTSNVPSTVSSPPTINFDSFYSSPPAGPFDQFWGRYINGNGICNTFTSYFETNSASLILIPYFEITDNTCTTSEESNFENLFFAILQQAGNLDYIFSNDLHNLSIINSLGEIINLNRENAPSALLSGEWFLHHIWDYDVLIENTFDPNLNIIFSDDIINGKSDFYGSSVCNGFSGLYDNPIQTSTFIIRSIGWTLIDCSFTPGSYFEQAYEQFFTAASIENIYLFEILGSGNNATLTIDNGYGSTLTYGRQALSNKDLSMQEIKLISNSAQDQIQLISQSNLAYTPYTINDISGRLIRSAQFNESNLISTNTLSSGIYILNVQNSKNQIVSFKFSKD